MDLNAKSRSNQDQPQSFSWPWASGRSRLHLQGEEHCGALFQMPQELTAQWSTLLACLAEQGEQRLSERDGLGPVTLGLVRRYRSDPLAGAQCQRLKSRNNFTFDSLGSGLCNTIGDEM